MRAPVSGGGLALYPVDRFREGGLDETAGARATARQWFDGAGGSLADLRRRYPKAKLALLSIFPRGETSDDEMRKNNAAANKLLAPLAREFGAEWLDLSRVFVDSQGVLSKELMPDLLHPSERGYDATFYGRVQPLAKRITGTWEATAIAPTIGPVAGTWSATLLPDDEDDGGSP